MNDVFTDIDAEVSPNGGVKRFFSNENSIITFPDHATDRIRGSLLGKTVGDFFIVEVPVVFLEHLLSWHAELYTDELESLVLESRDDLPNMIT